MLAVNYTNLRQDLKKYCDIASADFETIVVTRKQGKNVVMMSEDEYNNIMENLFIVSNKKNYDHILKSIDQLTKGQAKMRELIITENE